MKKIISLFKRDYENDRNLINEIVPGAEWVVAGEGIATRKFDGTCCLIRDGKMFKRYDHKPDNWKAIQKALKHGGQVPEPIMSAPPADFEPAQEPDPITLHWPGWLPVDDSNADQWHREALANELQFGPIADGTYELCGPKVAGNPEGFSKHVLVLHGVEPLFDVPTDFDELREYLRDTAMEGIVWHHPDGRMVKIKRKDFWK